MLYRWSLVLMALGGLLLVIGAGPAFILGMIAPSADATTVALLSLTVAPLGAVVLVVGVLFWLLATFMR